MNNISYSEDELLDYIFRNIIFVRNGYSAWEYNINIKALKFIEQQGRMTPAFLTEFLDSTYSDIQEGRYIGSAHGFNHFYTQRDVISTNPETLCAYLTFLCKKDISLFNKIFPIEAWAIRPIPDAIVNAMTDEGLILIGCKNHKPVIFDIMHDNEKMHTIINAIFNAQLDNAASKYNKKWFTSAQHSLEQLFYFVKTHSSDPAVDSFVDQIRKIIMDAKCKVAKSILKETLYKSFPEKTELDRLHEQNNTFLHRWGAFFKPIFHPAEKKLEQVKTKEAAVSLIK